jgi:hypothetical protein
VAELRESGGRSPGRSHVVEDQQGRSNSRSQAESDHRKRVDRPQRHGSSEPRATAARSATPDAGARSPRPDEGIHTTIFYALNTSAIGARLSVGTGRAIGSLTRSVSVFHTDSLLQVRKCGHRLAEFGHRRRVRQYAVGALERIDGEQARFVGVSITISSYYCQAPTRSRSRPALKRRTADPMSLYGPDVGIARRRRLSRPPRRRSSRPVRLTVTPCRLSEPVVSPIGFGGTRGGPALGVPAIAGLAECKHLDDDPGACSFHLLPCLSERR